MFDEICFPSGTPKSPKNRPAKSLSCQNATGNHFFAFSSLGRVPEGSRTDFESSGALPEQIFIGFCDIFSLVPPGSCRGLSGSAGMLPGSASNLCNPLSRVPLGYGDSRSGLNKIFYIRYILSKKLPAYGLRMTFPCGFRRVAKTH